MSMQLFSAPFMEQLKTEISEAVIKEISPLLKPSIQPPGEKFRTRKETAGILNVSLPTLNEYTKRKLITGYRFGVRVMYKQSDIEAALTKMNYGGTSHE